MQSVKPSSQADAIRPRAPSHPIRPRSPHHRAPAGRDAHRTPRGCAHIRQIQSAGTARERPGSYSWPALRREASQRFAAGHDPQRVIQELRDRRTDCPATAPSPRMRRWYTHARWLLPATPIPGKPRRERRPVPGNVRTHPVRVDATPPIGRHRPALARRRNPTEQRTADGSKRTTARASRHRRVSRPCRSDRRRPSPRASLHERVRSGSWPPCGPRRSARPARHYTWR